MSKRAERRAVAVLSEHALYRFATAQLLRERGFQVEECDAPAHLASTVRTRAVEAVFVDLDHAGEDVRVLLRHVHELSNTQVIPVGTTLRQAAALASPGDAGIETPSAGADALLAAANGQRPKASPELARLHRMWSEVTPRQRDVLRWLATGLDNRAIAARMHVGERAIKQHVSALLVALGCENRAQLALHAHRAGMRPPHG